MAQRAADLLVDCLIAQGADRMFCVPGESYLALLDALAGRAVDLVVCRHEGGAAMMAVADAKLTGRPGLLACSRGPGAANAAIGLHLAEQDAIPLVVLIGQVARWERGRGAFQEVDYDQFFGGIAKMVREVTEAEQLSETIARAFHVARSGTPGPVVVVLPEDMLSDMVEGEALPPQKMPTAGPAIENVDTAMEMLSRADRPLVIAGGGLHHDGGRAALAELAEVHGLPVALTFKHQDIFDNGSPLYAGHLGFKIPAPLLDTLSRADLVLAIATRLGDIPTQGHRLPSSPVPDQPLIHVWPDPAILGRVFATDLALPCDPAAFCHALAGRPRVHDVSDWTAEAHGAAAKLMGYDVRDMPDGLDFGAVAIALAERAPADTIVVTDSGNFSGWVHRVWPWDGRARAIGAA
ncbi:MAG: thiamine pyrophosphate-binding protein, partial [Jannaschia sp.]